MKISDVLESLVPVSGAEQAPGKAETEAAEGSSAREWTATTTETWLQGRSLFGGIQSAIAVRAMRHLVPRDFPLRVAQTTFIAPVPAGPVRVRASRLRTGKGTIHAEARLLVEDHTAALVIGVFGRGRPSKTDKMACVPPVSASSDPFEVRFVPGMSPNFLQHFSLRWVQGALPMSGSEDVPPAALDVGIDDRGPMSEEHVLAIADASPPLASAMLTERSRGSSVTWTVEMLTTDLERLALRDWHLYAEMRAGRDGYTSQTVLVCAPDGAPVAISDQTMMVFD
jgi:acyl-CoA thioesterase